MDKETPSEANLAVILGTPTHSEYAHLESLVRNFLAEQYAVVRRVLENNSPLLEKIRNELLQSTVLDQREIARIYEELGKSEMANQTSPA